METTNIKIWLQSQGGAASLHPTAKAVQFPGKAKGSKKMGSEMQGELYCTRTRVCFLFTRPLWIFLGGYFSGILRITVEDYIDSPNTVVNKDI